MANIADNSKLVADWIAYHQDSKGWDDEHNETPGEQLDALIQTDPLNALLVMYRIAEQTSEENILGQLGAGPLEDLLGSDAGATYADEIIARARQDKNWRLVFGCVWTSGFKDRAAAKKVEDNIDTFFPNGRP